MTFSTNNSSGKPSTSKSSGIALKTTKEEDVKSSSSDDDENLSIEDFEKQLALLTRKFRRNFRRGNPSKSSSFGKSGKGKGALNVKSRKQESSSKDKKNNKGQIQCFKCLGFGHIVWVMNIWI